MIESFVGKYGDPRVKDYFLMQSPVPVLMIVITYVFSVKVLGPKLMKDRKPFELKQILMIYNLFQVMLSSYLFYKGFMIWVFEYNWRCEPLNHDESPKQFSIINAWYLYFLSKFPEFLDTIFFVMRKKFSQVSSLHLIHHAVMPILTWIGMKFSPGGIYIFQ
jgi:elongation of very long chain fatty acids protein 7